MSAAEYEHNSKKIICIIRRFEILCLRWLLLINIRHIEIFSGGVVLDVDGPTKYIASNLTS